MSQEVRLFPKKDLKRWDANTETKEIVNYKLKTSRGRAFPTEDLKTPFIANRESQEVVVCQVVYCQKKIQEAAYLVIETYFQ